MTTIAPPAQAITPDFPADVKTCRPKNLIARYAGSNIGGSTVFMGVEVKNIGATPCLIQLWPELELVDVDGMKINIIYGYYIEPANPPSYVLLEPEQTGGFNLQWGNWCQPPVAYGVIIRVILPNENGFIDAPTNGTDPINGTIYKGGKCVDPGAKSFILIGKFEYGPVIVQP